jgi:hypothetical protein
MATLGEKLQTAAAGSAGMHTPHVAQSRSMTSPPRIKRSLKIGYPIWISGPLSGIPFVKPAAGHAEQDLMMIELRKERRKKAKRYALVTLNR